MVAKTTIALVFLAAQMLSVTAVADDQSEHDANLAHTMPTHLVDVRLALPRKIYKGLPAIAEITLLNNRRIQLKREKIGNASDADVLQLIKESMDFHYPAFDFFARKPPISVQIVTLKGHRLAKEARQPDASAFWVGGLSPGTAEFPRRVQSATMWATRCKSILVDLTSYFKDLEPGDYAVEVFVYAAEDRLPWRSNRVAVEIQGLPEQLLKTIRDAVPIVPDDRGQEKTLNWLDESMNIGLLKKLPPEHFAGLAVYAFLSEARKAGAVDKIPLDILDQIPGYIKPTAYCWKYEVLATRKDPAARELRRSLELAHPEVIWRLHQVDDGQGFLATWLRKKS